MRGDIIHTVELLTIHQAPVTTFEVPQWLLEVFGPFMFHFW